MRNRFCRIVGVGAWILLSTVVLADEKTYPIQLSRSMKVGDKYALVFAAKTVSITVPKLPVAASPTRREDSVNLQCTERVVAIEPQSQSATKVEITVDEFTMDDAKLAAPGTAISIENTGDKTLYVIDGKSVDTNTERALAAVISLRSPNNTDSYDAVFGTKQPQKVGDTWQINSELAAKGYSNSHRNVNAANVTGSSKLIAADKRNMMTVELDIAVKKIQGDWAGGWNITDGALASHWTADIPTDPASDPGEVREEFTESLELVKKDTNGKSYEDTVKRELSKTSTRTRIADP